MFGEPEKSLANLVHSYLGELLLYEPSSGSSMNCNEAVFGVQNASLDMFWELFIEFDEPCIWLFETWELSYGRGKIETATHGWQRECFQPLTSEEMASFVDLWEGQHYLWEPADKD